MPPLPTPCCLTRRVFLLAFATLVGLIAAPLAQANVNSVESADFSNALASPTPVGTLGVGLNTISGSVLGVRHTAGLPLTEDIFDAFSFTVPDGFVVTRVRLDITNWSAQSAGGPPLNATGGAGNSTGVANFRNVTGNATFANIISTSDGTVGPGTYTFWAQISDFPTGHTAADQAGYSYVYTITAVPLVEYIESADIITVPLGTLPSPTGGAADGAFVRVGGSVTGNSVPTGPTFGWRGDTTDTYTFEIPVGSVGTSLAADILSFQTTGATSTGPTGVAQLSNQTTGESYSRTLTANGTFTDLVPASAGGVLSPGQWTITMNANPDSAILGGQQVSYSYIVRFVTTTDSGACCNRWTGSCVLTPVRTCLGLGLRYDGPGSACGATPCRDCPADFDGSGTLQIADVFAFLNAWFAGCP